VISGQRGGGPVSEKLLRFFKLSELVTVRLVCKHQKCGAIVELPLNQIEKMFKEGRCRVCGEPFHVKETLQGFIQGPIPEFNWLSELALSVAKLNHSGVMVDVEFVIPGKEICRPDRDA
jgi:hypothetical protein